MPQLIELPPTIPFIYEQIPEPDEGQAAVALEGIAGILRMANCVKPGSTEVCVDAVVCAAQGCQR